MKTFLIGDAGGNKTAWHLQQQQHANTYTTSGFNAFTHSLEKFKKDIRDNFNVPIGNVYLYISGADTIEQKKEIAEELKEIFGVKPIVENDLLGAARAVCSNHAGYVGILGTGSNAAYYDGKQVDKVSASLGYLLGDEGGGAYLGKQVLKAALRNQLPYPILEAFRRSHPLSIAETLHKIYAEKKISHYLSTFTKFIYQHRETPEINQLIVTAFQDFFKAYFPLNNITLPIHFVGSIAYYFENELRQAGRKMNIEIKNVVQSPISGLVKYHLENL